MGFISYSGANGLPGSCLNFLQDKQGNLWVGSYSNGVSRFDGKQWENWDANSGLIQNIVIQIFEDRFGTIWLDHAEYGATSYRNGQFEAVPESNGIGQHKRILFDPISQVPFLLDDVTTERFDLAENYYQFSTTGKPILPAEFISKYTKLTFHLISSNGTYIFLGLKKGAGTADIIEVSRDNKYIHKTMSISSQFFQCEVLGNNDGKIILKNPYRPKIFQIQGGKIAPFIPPTITSGANFNTRLEIEKVVQSSDRRSLITIWGIKENRAGAPRYLLAEYDFTSFELKKTLVFSTYHKINSAIKDFAGTYWISTDANILRLFPEFFFIPTESPGMISSVWAISEARDKKIWMASYGFGMAYLDGLNVHRPGKIIDENAHFDNGSTVDADGNMYFNTEKFCLNGKDYQGLVKFDGSHIEMLTSGTLGYFLGYDRNGQIMRGMNNHGLWILRKNKSGKKIDDWLKINKTKGLLLGNIITAVQDTLGRYWMGRLSKGIACYDPVADTVINWTKDEEKRNYGAMCMEIDLHGNIWIGTDRGLCFLKCPPIISKNFKLADAMVPIGPMYTGIGKITTLKLFENKNLLFSNGKGFYILDLNAFYSKQNNIIIREYNEKNGNLLTGIEQNACFVSKDKKIWLAGNNGVLCFDPAFSYRDTFIPSIIIDSLCTDQLKAIPSDQKIYTGSGNPRIKIYFHTITNPFLFDNAHYQCRLNNGEWSPIVDKSIIEYTNLNPGTYRLEIRSEKNGKHSTSACISFVVELVWWENPFVWALSLIALTLLVLVITSRERKIGRQELQLNKSNIELTLMQKEKDLMQKEKDLMQREKDKLQVYAIINQLNPHFINNALHWVQIRIGADKQALSVLTKLSENIATVFKNSRQKRSSHALSQEIKLVENYLFIQECRFKNSLTYDIGIPKEILEKIEVPIMLLQIHVENAIEHGIRKKSDGVGFVGIQASYRKDYIEINITDNGIGRTAAAKFHSHGSQNGLKMLTELILIFNRSNESKFEQYYEDDIFQRDDGVKYGTRVIIKIPKTYQYVD